MNIRRVAKTDRFEEVARRLTGDHPASAADGANWVERLTKDLAIPGLASYGLREADFDGLIVKAKNASSMRANPVSLTDAELAEILREAL